MKKNLILFGVVTIVLFSIGIVVADSGWVDDGTAVRLNTSTDKVGIGTAVPFTFAKLTVQDGNIFIRNGTANQQTNYASFNYGLAFADATGNDGNGPGALITAVGAPNYGANLQFITRSGNGDTAKERMRITSEGDIVAIGNITVNSSLNFGSFFKFGKRIVEGNVDVFELFNRDNQLMMDILQYNNYVAAEEYVSEFRFFQTRPGNAAGHAPFLNLYQQGNDGEAAIRFDNSVSGGGPRANPWMIGIPPDPNLADHYHFMINRDGNGVAFIIDENLNVGLGPGFTSAVNTAQHPKAAVEVRGGDTYVSDAGKGVIVKSPNGATCKRIGIDNSGNIVGTTVTC